MKKCVMCCLMWGVSAMWTGCIGSGSFDGQDVMDETREEVSMVLEHESRDASGVWHVEALQWFTFEIEQDACPPQRGMPESLSIVCDASDEEGVLTIQGIALASGEYEVMFGDSSLSFNVYDGEGKRYLRSFTLGQGETLKLSARGIRRVFVSQSRVVSVTSTSSAPHAFLATARAEGTAFVVFYGSREKKVYQINVLGDGEIPPTVDKVIELEEGEVWSGVSTLGVKEVHIGVQDVLEVNSTRDAKSQGLTFTGRRAGVTAVTFISEFDETTTLWFRVVESRK